MNKNPLKTIQQRNNSNQILVSRLDTKNVVNEPIILNKQQQEIILVENSLFSLATYKNYSYQFENFADNYLPYVHPMVILSTTSGNYFPTGATAYTSPEIFTYTTTNWWEQTNTNYVLKFSTQAILAFKWDDYDNRYYAPVYLTIKLKIYNTQLFNSFKVVE